MTIAIEEIVSTGDNVIQEVQTLYERSFPPAERQPFERIRQMLDAPEGGGRLHLFAGQDGNRVLGLSIFRYLMEVSIGYLWYLCVAEGARGTGLGSRLYQATLDALHNDAKLLQTGLRGLIFEVELPSGKQVPVYGDPIRRIRFYERLGARLVIGYDYWQPPILPYGSVRLQLMFHPLDLSLRECTPAVLSQVISGFRLHAQGVDEAVDACGLRLGVLSDGGESGV